MYNNNRFLDIIVEPHLSRFTPKADISCNFTGRRKLIDQWTLSPAHGSEYQKPHAGRTTHKYIYLACACTPFTHAGSKYPTCEESYNIRRKQ